MDSKRDLIVEILKKAGEAQINLGSDFACETLAEKIVHELNRYTEKLYRNGK